MLSCTWVTVAAFDTNRNVLKTTNSKDEMRPVMCAVTVGVLHGSQRQVDVFLESANPAGTTCLHLEMRAYEEERLQGQQAASFGLTSI
ncbi:Mucin-2 [Manis pentadactyla]|nr:Mucin-2 [Manis pentadactyla]